MQASREQIKNLGRLKSRPDFLHVQKKGRKWFSKGLVLEAAPNPDGQIRFGLTVSKRAHKSAVKRNRIKRRLRAAALEIIPLEATAGTDYVLIGRTETLTRPYASLQKDLRWCLKKLGCLKTDSGYENT